MSPFSTVNGGQHVTKYVAFELLLHAAFVADEIWGFMLGPQLVLLILLCCTSIGRTSTASSRSYKVYVCYLLALLNLSRRGKGRGGTHTLSPPASPRVDMRELQIPVVLPFVDAHIKHLGHSVVHPLNASVAVRMIGACGKLAHSQQLVYSL